MLQKVTEILSRSRFDVHNERATQDQVERVLDQAGVPYERERPLNEKNRPDFYVEGIAIEVKIKGGAAAIYRQIERYCQFQEVSSIILLTNRSMGLPPQINGRPCYVIKMGKSWL